jgi:FHA domain
VDEELALAALKLERSEFVADLSRWFLIVPVENAAQPSVRFRTVASEYVKELAKFVNGQAESERQSLKSPRWNRQGWNPISLQKRKGPYLDRISIGRAPNVDVVIHSRFVSKLHAHIAFPEGETLTVTDLDSQNGTFINGERLTPRSRTAIANGDILSFGEVHCELATSDVVYYALRRKYLLLLAPQEGSALPSDGGPGER